MQFAELRNVLLRDAVTVEGTNLKSITAHFLPHDAKILNRWEGTLEDVALARAIAKAKKKGLIEELEMNNAVLGHIRSMCLTLPCKQEGDDDGTVV